MSSERASQRQGISFQTGTPEIVKAHADQLSVVPDGWIHPREDLDEDVHDTVFALLQRLADRRAVKIRTVNDNPNSEYQRHREYRVTDRTRELVDNVLENRDAMMPCGHSGLNNRGDYFECSFELCDKEFQREDIDA